ncbi:MAG: hypothetical protein R5N60_00290 [Cutibacterium granulosum]|nr:hypothetical protein [Cutibacterium granulosum]
MNREEASRGLQEGYASINRVFNALFEPVNDLAVQDNQNATNAVYLLDSILDLIELARSMMGCVPDETWQATP